MSVDIYLTRVDDDDEVLAQVNYLRNPFGLAEWLEVNAGSSNLIHMIKEHTTNGNKWTRGDIAREAAKTWHTISSITIGYYRLALDWSWHWPMDSKPCLWSMADEHEWLWEHIKVVDVFPKRRKEVRWTPYRNSPNVTMCIVDMEMFRKALPASERDRYFHTNTLEGYKQWVKELVGIGLGYTDPTTKLIYSA